MADLPGLDLQRLGAWLDANCPGLAQGPLSARLLAGGRSNLTYAVSDGAGSWVVRRPPLGHVLATAHDMAREARVLRALAGTTVPVPRVHAACEDATVLGAPFYVMELVDGVPYRSAAALEALGPARTAAIAMRMIDILADLHALDPAALGLADFGRPQGFLARQVRRWKQQLDASRSRDIPGIDALHARLAADPPDGAPATLVHGDYRLDNLLVDAQDRVAAVVDWEMATLADPLTDLGLLLVYQRMGELGGEAMASAAPGYPSEDALLQRYAARSGRDLGELGYHVALASFKLAVIAEGIHYRHLHGQTVGEGFEHFGRMVAPLVASGLSALGDRH